MQVDRGSTTRDIGDARGDCRAQSAVARDEQEIEDHAKDQGDERRER